GAGRPEDGAPRTPAAAGVRGAPSAERASASVPRQRRLRGDVLRARLAERVGVRGLVVAVLDVVLQRLGDRVTQRLVVLVHADAVGLLGERVVHHAQLVGTLGGVALEDRVVGGQGVGLVVEHLLDAVGVLVGLLRVGAVLRLLDLL